MLWGCKNLIHGFATIKIDSNADLISFRFTAPANVTLNSFNIYVTSVSGTPPKLNFRLREDNGSGQPSTSNLVSASVDAGSGWRATTSFTKTLEMNKVYHCVIEGSSGHNASNYHLLRTLKRVVIGDE